MNTSRNLLEIWLPNGSAGWSIRRVDEHLRFGQINPFVPIRHHTGDDPVFFAEVIQVRNGQRELPGLTLGELQDGPSIFLAVGMREALLALADTDPVRVLLSRLKGRLAAHCRVPLRRNLVRPFLPADGSSALSITGLRCTLREFLASHGAERTGASQWRQRLGNLTQRGLRPDEIRCSQAEANLDWQNAVIPAGDVLPEGAYGDLRLSVIAVQDESERQLRFVRVERPQDVSRLKPKLPGGQASVPAWRDPVLGYWIDRVSWVDMLGETRAWIALSSRGVLLTSARHPSGWCDKVDEAKALACADARRVLPKMASAGEWSDLRVAGGKEYREWLVTLPWYRPRYRSPHFEHDNILLHMRCDVRETADGRRVLLLQEVQSDWAQRARRGESRGDATGERIPVPPWLGEWLALALKLLLLHAAREGYGALAWTTGAMQVERYGGEGAAGLKLLYDRTLPAEAARLMKRHRVVCQAIELFQPVNYRIEPDDTGYAVFDSEQELIGRGATYEEALAYVPDGARDRLVPFHAVSLEQTVREAIIADGFFAWGHGLTASFVSLADRQPISIPGSERSALKTGDPK